MVVNIAGPRHTRQLRDLRRHRRLAPPGAAPFTMLRAADGVCLVRKATCTDEPLMILPVPF